MACFFGDGATNQGAFHEAANMAALWELPVVFICENNQYAVSLRVERHMAAASFSDRALSYHLKGISVDGNDAAAVCGAVSEAAALARRGQPGFVVAETYRIAGHSKSDGNLYRDPREMESWREKCPIGRLYGTDS